jgi:hypothetical protein
VQLSYRVGNQHAKSFDAISTDVRPINAILSTPRGEKSDTSCEQLLKAVKDGNTILIAFQAKQVIYTKEDDKTRVSRVIAQDWVGKRVDQLATATGVADTESPFITSRGERWLYLSEEVKKLIRAPPP